MTDPTNPIPAPAAADTASFRTPSGDGQAVTDLTGLSPQSAGFFMSPEAAVRTHGLGIVEALVTDGVNPRHALELLAVHMSMPTGLPRVEGAGEPAHVEIMGHVSFDGLVRVVGRRTKDADTLTPGGIIVEYFDSDSGRPAARWCSNASIFSLSAQPMGEMVGRLCNNAFGWARHSPEPIFDRWQAMAEPGAEYDTSSLLDVAALEFTAAVAACALPGAWGKALAPAVVLQHLQRAISDQDRGDITATALPRWLPQRTIDAVLAWDRARKADKPARDDSGWGFDVRVPPRSVELHLAPSGDGNDSDDDPVPM